MYRDVPRFCSTDHDWYSQPQKWKRVLHHSPFKQEIPRVFFWGVLSSTSLLIILACYSFA